MSLSLPEDIEPHLTSDVKAWSSPGVYCLTLDVPSDVRERWESVFDTTPDYLDMVEQKERTVYVGAAKNVLSRLEDHRDGDVRKVALLEVCEIDSLRNIWWMDSVEQAFLKEQTMADMLTHEYPSWYVHSR